MTTLKLGGGTRTIPIKTTSDLTISRKAVEEILQETGDKIADMLEQMMRGRWIDNHGHRVENNVQMMELARQLKVLGEFRAQHLGYEPWKEQPNV